MTATNKEASSSSVGVSIAIGVLKVIDSLAWVVSGGPFRKPKPVDAEMNSERVGEEVVVVMSKVHHTGGGPYLRMVMIFV